MTVSVVDGSAETVAHRTHAILAELLKGKAVTAADVEERFGVDKSTASRDLSLLDEIYDLDQFWVDDSKYFAIDEDRPISVHQSVCEP